MTSTRETAGRAARLADLTDALQGLQAAQRRVRSREAQQPEALSFAQWRLLRPLAAQDALNALNATTLARAAELAPATVTAMLDQLVTAGIVERARCDADRRVVQNRLTPAGKAAWRAKEDELRTKWTNALAGLTDDDLEAGARVLVQLRGYFETL